MMAGNEKAYRDKSHSRHPNLCWNSITKACQTQRWQNKDCKPPIQIHWHTARTTIHQHIKLTLRPSTQYWIKKKSAWKPTRISHAAVQSSRRGHFVFLLEECRWAESRTDKPETAVKAEEQLNEHLIFCSRFYSRSSSSMARNAETLPAQGHRATDAAGVRRKAGNVPFTSCYRGESL